MPRFKNKITGSIVNVDEETAKTLDQTFVKVAEKASSASEK